MPLGTEGVGKFFGALGGSSALRQRAAALGRQDAMREALVNADIGNVGAEAALRNVKLQALDPATIAASLAGAGVPQENAAGAGGLVRAGQNVSQVANLMKILHQQAALKQAQAAYANGDPNAANQALAVANGKPVDMTKVSDGVAFNPQTTPDQTISPTAIGQAMILAHNAAAANSYAGATQKRTLTPLQAAHLMAETANVGNTKTTPTPLPENVANALLGKVHDANGVATPNPVAYQQFLSWQADKAATDKRYLNSAFASQQYAGNAPYGSLLAAQSSTSQPVTDLQGNPIKDDNGNPVLNKSTQIKSMPLQAPAPPVDPGFVNSIMSAAAGTGTPSGASLPNTAPTAATPAPANQDVSAPATPQGYATPKTEAEYNALPAGAQYMHPDGTLRIKGAN